MKITFEGSTYAEIENAMVQTLIDTGCVVTVMGRQAGAVKFGGSQPVLKGSIGEVFENTGDNSPPTVHDLAQGSGPEAQGSNGAAPAQPSKPAKTSAKPPKTKAKTQQEPAEEQAKIDAAMDEPTPSEMVAIRQKTIEDLQAAYSGGKQKEVFKLLAEHGNGAKSFRELTVEAFLPIRKAIDEGALA